MSEVMELSGAPGGKVRSAWERAKDDNPGMRARDAAALLGVSEAGLVASLVDHGAVRLEGDFSRLIERMPEAGEVMALTRNESCVHEKIGEYGNIDISSGGGVVLNHDIDLRVFMGQWRHGYTIEEPMKDGGLRRSLQFFDGAGVAVHKIYARDATDITSWSGIVDAFRADDQSDVFEPQVYPAKPAEKADSEIDIPGLCAAWEALEDVHDFFGMLREFGVGRHQAFRLVGAPHAERVQVGSACRVLETAAQRSAPIMVFVGNRGCIQIHSGPVERIKAMGPWLNVLDPRFNLHLREDRIESAWLIRKPTRDGIVTSLELFDADGVNFAMFFGERKPGQSERDDWREIVGTLEAA